eukprot:3718373-Ditylum_brightwellii.AAC.1
MKPITSNIDTSNSITISTITGKGNITMTPMDNSAKKVSDNNTNSTATSLQNSSSDNSSDPAKENDKTAEMSMTTLPQKN